MHLTGPICVNGPNIKLKMFMQKDIIFGFSVQISFSIMRIFDDCEVKRSKSYELRNS